MSHVTGDVVRQGRVIGHFVYNCGADQLHTPKVYSRRELDAVEDYRELEWTSCRCGGATVAVLLVMKYGQVVHWASRLCERCGILTENLAPAHDEMLTGRPPNEVSRPTNVDTYEAFAASGIVPGDRLHLGIVGNHVCDDATFLGLMAGGGGIKVEIAGRVVDDLHWGDIIELWRLPVSDS